MKSLIAGSMLWMAASSGSWFDLPGVPEGIEGWFYNARERTDSGLEAAESGDTEAAMEALDAAARLSPEDPLTHFNAGTGRLLAQEQGAVEALQLAAESVDDALRSRALYNLGNAHLAADNPAAAVEAFKNSLRTAPGQLDAKHNLELALKALEEQQSSQGQDQETPDSDQQGNEEQSDSEGNEDPSEQEQAEGEDSDQDQSPEGQPDPGDPEEGDQKERPLPDFEDQPDMTAEQAAAILEAVENLEREQRQEQAAKQLKARRKGDRDW